MTPIAGHLAKSIFHAKFHIHGDLPPITSDDRDLAKLDEESANTFLRKETKESTGWIRSRGKLNEHSETESLDIPGVGTFRVSGSKV